MRNLVPYVVSQLNCADECPFPLVSVSIDESTVFCCFQEGPIIAVHAWTPSSSWIAAVEIEYAEDKVVCIKGNAFAHSCVIVLENGDILEADFAQGCEQMTVLHSFNKKVWTCEWSPDGEIVAVVLSDEQAGFELVLLSQSFEFLSSHTFSDTDLALAEKHVTVGWGKRETQFQGKGMKRDPTVQYNPQSGVVSTMDDASVSVCWRGDGEFLVVNARLDYSERTTRRALFVFTRDGQLSSVSEPVDFLLPSVAWQPSGQFIAAACAPNDDKQYTIQLFERNGLKRTEISLPIGLQKPTSLQWSSNSAVLAVNTGTENSEESGTSEGLSYLFVMKNWRWYLKHVTSELENAVTRWHPEQPYTLVQHNMETVKFSTYQLASQTNDQGLAAVIDYTEVGVTPLGFANVPPPMSFANVSLPAPVQSVACSGEDRVVAALIDGTICDIKLDLEEEELTIVSEYKLLVRPRLVTFAANGDIIVSLETNVLMQLSNGQAEILRETDQISVLKGDYYLCKSQLFRVADGSIVSDFSQPVLDFFVSGPDTYALARNGSLLFNSRVLAQGVTSMFATSTHLLFTTLNKLKFIHLNVSNPVVPGDDEINEQCREIERGSLLVSVIPANMSVVLQAPRGNLETIYPRMLVLNKIRECVASLDYSRAFIECKTHRIDMNLLYDLDPKQFESNVQLVVEQLRSEANIDLFLSSLEDVDVTLTKYVDTGKTSTEDNTNAADSKEQGKRPEKVNQLLEFIAPFIPVTCQITALALAHPPKLAEALELASASPEHVKHLLFLSDAQQMYRVALTAYNPRLALLVAQQAQMDPKEYLPFLKARDSESEYLSKFNIDVYLKNYNRALPNLINDPESSDSSIVEFVKHHELYVEALQLLRGTGRECESKLLEMQAELLLRSSNYVKAGENYEALKDNQKAIDAYVLGGEWRRAIALTDSENRKEVAERLVEVNEMNKHYEGAAHIYAYFLNNYQKAVECYCQCNAFDDAVMISRLHNLNDVLETGLRESFSSFQELISDCTQQVNSQLKRLRDIRLKRDENVLGFDNLDNDFADDVSVAGTETTNASAYTRYTDKSSTGTAATNATRRTLKNQRRQERKKVRGKKGSVYEEDYLIASTARLVERITTNRKDLQALISTLARTNLLVYTNQLVSGYNALIALLDANLDEIYSIDEKSLIRYDASGHEIKVEKPKKPELPETVHV
ncbi:Elongator subunit [Starmerella bacillaris]|uniref:Elongator complex protein 1 n=1 Tax=Starmerella bacillaris TaxID=1247836 RepID=A0AAV5RPK5_STABA|nr:Elongator subunit [Starmerella bacillaris]